MTSCEIMGAVDGHGSFGRMALFATLQVHAAALQTCNQPCLCMCLQYGLAAATADSRHRPHVSGPSETCSVACNWPELSMLRDSYV